MANEGTNDGTAFDRFVTVRRDGDRLAVEGPASWVRTLDMRAIEDRAGMLAAASPNPLPPEKAAELALRLDFAAWLGALSLGRGGMKGQDVGA